MQINKLPNGCQINPYQTVNQYYLRRETLKQHYAVVVKQVESSLLDIVASVVDRSYYAVNGAIRQWRNKNRGILSSYRSIATIESRRSRDGNYPLY